MLKFSANLGFLWADLRLPDSIFAAKSAGFTGVECHWPYDTPALEIRDVLAATGMEMVSLNTRRGDVDAGENGLAAVTGRQAQARDFIDEAVTYASQIGCRNVHVMAGRTDRGPLAQSTFCENLTYAADRAASQGVTVLIEPLNHRDAPGYHLSNLEDAAATIRSIGRANVKIMYDCYHVQIMQGDLLNRFKAHLPDIGHVQIAGVPDRLEPDCGEVNYAWLLREIDAAGWHGFIGAEYKPRGELVAGLGWLADFSDALKN